MRKCIFVIFGYIPFFLLPVTSLAATYYVASNGTNSNPGTEGEPWATVRHAVSRVIAGDMVYIRGGTYTEKNTYISCSGVTFKAYTGENPIFDAQNSGPDWEGIFVISGNNNVLEGIEARNSYGYGIEINESNNTIRSCTTRFTRRSGIVTYAGHKVSGNTVEYCTITEAARDQLEGGDWSGGISNRNADNITVRGNLVYNNHGEGINVFWGCDTALVEYNVVYNNKACELYFDNAQNITARYNLIYGTTDVNWWRVQINPSQNHPSWGIYVGAESGGGCVHGDNYKIYGNLFAYNAWNIAYWQQCGGDLYANHYIYNNTFVEGHTGGIDLRHLNNVYFKNNIIWQSSGALIASSDVHGTQAFDHNLWSSDPGTSYRGINDPSYAAPTIRKSSGWRSIVGGELSGRDFALEVGSPAINRGVNLGAQYSFTPDCNTSDWTKRDISLIDQNQYGSGWEIGADVDIENTSPLPPTGVRIRVVR